MYEETITEADRQTYELQQKKASEQASTDTSIQKGAWGQFGSPAGGPSVAQQPDSSLIQSDIQARGTKALSEYEKNIIEAQRLRKQQAAEMAPLYGQVADAIDKPFPTPPGVPKPPPIPTREGSIDQTAAKALFTVASVIGALGMMGGRGRGMLAMSGVTGMVEGFREGNAEKYKAAKEQYDAAVNEQLNQYHMEHQFYLDTMNQRNMNIRDKLLTIELRARATGDKIAAAEAGAGEWGKMADYVDHFGQMINNFQKQVDTQSIFGLRQKQAEIGLEKSKVELEKQKIELEKTKAGGGKTPAETRQELTALLRSYEKERDALQKEVNAFNWGMGTPKEAKTKLDAVNSKIAGIRQQLEGGGQQKPGKGPLTKEMAAQILQEAGGNKDRARQIARERGYDF